MIRSLLSRARAHVISIGAALSLLAAHAWGLGLGEIKLNSALNEKLKAEIELLDASDMQPDEIRVSLASTEDFERVGVERFFFLTDLRFEVAFSSSSGVKVDVTSTKPITEPYLNFIVEVLWPNGRLLKEYTLLLDPPTFSSAAAPVVAPPARTASSGGSGDDVTRTAPSGGTRVSLAPPSPSTPAPRNIGGELMTDQSDTLWEIAQRTRPEGVSIAQDMLAIQKLNPQAFIRNNINLLKAGYSLRLPTAEEARALSQQQAVALVAEQNADWRAYNRGEAPAVETQVAQSVPSEFQGQVDATAERAEPVVESASEGELRIVAGVGDSVSGTAAAETVAQLDAAREEQDRLSREVDELAYQMDRERELSTNQLAVKDRQLEVKDQQIAELQAQMAQVRQELNEARQNQNQSVPAPEQAKSWWESSYVLGGAAGALVLALVAGLIGARRKRPVEDEVAVAAVTPRAARTSTTAAAAKAATADEGASVQAASGVSGDSGAHDAVPAPGDGDVLAEAEIYIAYGRLPRAISLLQDAIEEEPERDDVRLKLLELYVESGERGAFSAQLTEFMGRCQDEEMRDAARELEARLTGGALDVSQEAPVKAEAAEDEAESNVMDFDLGLDDEPASTTAVEADGGEREFDLELDEDEGASRGAGDQLGGDLGIDFKPEATALDADEEGSEVATIDEDEFDFDVESDADSAETKLDLAKAYIDMGDEDGARDILKEVLEEGTSDQQTKAQTLLEQL